MEPKAGNLSWIDLEMTGLEPETNLILEIASIVTDKDLNILAEGPEIAIKQPDDVLEAMDDWNSKTHSESGLLAKCKESEYTVKSAQKETLDFLRMYLEPGMSCLCGNSIHHDRSFLRRYMPEIESFHSYRILDVTSFREVIQRWYPDAPPYEKAGTHRAHLDIKESIGELRHYRDLFFRSAMRQ